MIFFVQLEVALKRCTTSKAVERGGTAPYNMGGPGLRGERIKRKEKEKRRRNKREKIE